MNWFDFIYVCVEVFRVEGLFGLTYIVCGSTIFFSVGISSGCNSIKPCLSVCVGLAVDVKWNFQVRIEFNPNHAGLMSGWMSGQRCSGFSLIIQECEFGLLFIQMFTLKTSMMINKLPLSWEVPSTISLIKNKYCLIALQTIF